MLTTFLRMEDAIFIYSFALREPGPYINIVTGNNGAGKSSLLQAITLGKTYCCYLVFNCLCEYSRNNFYGQLRFRSWP